MGKFERSREILRVMAEKRNRIRDRDSTCALYGRRRRRFFFSLSLSQSLLRGRKNKGRGEKLFSLWQEFKYKEMAVYGAIKVLRCRPLETGFSRL